MLDTIYALLLGGFYALRESGVALRARRKLYVLRGGQIHHSVRIQSGARIFGARNCVIGEGSFIGRNSRIFAYYERVQVGRNVLIAEGVKVITHNHQFSRVEVPVSEQGYSCAPVCIEDDVWLGFDAKILAGVTIGRGAVVAAGSVVSADVAEYAVVGGVPAAFIKSRLGIGPSQS